MVTFPTAPIMKPRRKTAELIMSEAQKQAMIRIATTSLNKGAKLGVKLDKTQRDARAAIADALTDWLDWMEAEEAAVVRSFFLQISVLASASGRSKIAKHSKFPSDLSDEIEAQLEAMKEAVEAKRREEAEAKRREEAEAKEKAKAEAAAAAAEAEQGDAGGKAEKM